MRLLAISPAAESTSRASATCPTTSASVASRVPRLTLCRVSDRSTRARSTREVMIAGATAKISIARTVMPIAPANAIAFN